MQPRPWWQPQPQTNQPTISARLLQSPHDRAETARSPWHHCTKCLAKSTPAIRERFAPAYLGLFYNSRRTSVFNLFKTPMACFDSLSFQQPPLLKIFSRYSFDSAIELRSASTNQSSSELIIRAEEQSRRHKEAQVLERSQNPFQSFFVGSFTIILWFHEIVLYSIRHQWRS